MHNNFQEMVHFEIKNLFMINQTEKKRIGEIRDVSEVEATSVIDVFNVLLFSNLLNGKSFLTEFFF